jgi:hypothetical protein
MLQPTSAPRKTFPNGQPQPTPFPEHHKQAHAIGSTVPNNVYHAPRGALMEDWSHKPKQRVTDNTRWTCAGCGDNFRPKRNDAIFCGPKCKQKAYRRRVTANTAVAV